MNTANTLAAIDDVRHDVDAWNHDTPTRTYTVAVGPFSLKVKPLGAGWCYDVRHEQEGLLVALMAETAAEARRLALDYATLKVHELAHA